MMLSNIIPGWFTGRNYSWSPEVLLNLPGVQIIWSNSRCRLHTSAALQLQLFVSDLPLNQSEYTADTLSSRVERDEYRRPETYAVREEFSLFLFCWVEREKLLFLLFQSGFDDAMNMENENARFLMSSFC